MTNTNINRKRFLYDSDSLHTEEKSFEHFIGSDIYYMDRKITVESKRSEKYQSSPVQSLFELPDELCSQALSDVEKQNPATTIHGRNLDNCKEEAIEFSILPSVNSKRSELFNEINDTRSQFIKQSGEITMLRDRLLQHQNSEMSLREKLTQLENSKQSIVSQSEKALRAEIANLKTQLSFRDRELLQFHEHLDKLQLLRFANLRKAYQGNMLPSSDLQSDGSVSKRDYFNSDLRNTIMKPVTANEHIDGHSSFSLVHYKSSMTHTWNAVGKNATTNNLYSVLESFIEIFTVMQNHYWITLQKEFTKQLKACNGNNFDRINVVLFLRVVEVIIQEVITNELKSNCTPTLTQDVKKSITLVPYLRYVINILTILARCYSSLVNCILMPSDVKLPLVQDQQNIEKFEVTSRKEYNFSQRIKEEPTTADLIENKFTYKIFPEIVSLLNCHDTETSEFAMKFLTTLAQNCEVNSLKRIALVFSTGALDHYLNGHMSNINKRVIGMVPFLSCFLRQSELLLQLYDSPNCTILYRLCSYLSEEGSIPFTDVRGCKMTVLSFVSSLVTSKTFVMQLRSEREMFFVGDELYKCIIDFLNAELKSNWKNLLLSHKISISIISRGLWLLHFLGLQLPSLLNYYRTDKTFLRLGTTLFSLQKNDQNWMQIDGFLQGLWEFDVEEC